MGKLYQNYFNSSVYLNSPILAELVFYLMTQTILGFSEFK